MMVVSFQLRADEQLAGFFLLAGTRGAWAVVNRPRW